MVLAAACGKDDITYVDASQFDNIDNITFDRTVNVTFLSSGATVDYSASDFTYDIDGAGVTITNNSSEKIYYRLSGSTADGYFKVYSSTPQAIELNGVNITNPSGAAINVQGPTEHPGRGCRAYMVLSGSNSVADGSTYSTPSDEDEKGAIFAEGILSFSGNGSLTVTAIGKSGIASDTYVHMMGGTVTVNCSTAVSVSSSDTLKPACVKSQDSFIMTSGTLTVTASGTGGKGISGDGTAIFRGGSVNVTVTGSNYGSSSSGGGPGPGRSNNSSSSSVAAKGIKFDGNITISGGSLTVSAASHEGIESKGTISITGGEVYCYSAADDAINSASDFTIDGGFVYAYAPENDGLDANGDFYVNGGVVYAIGASSPEVAIDANTEESKTLYINGGTLIAIGGLESGAELKQSCYQASSWTANTNYTLTVGSTTYSFTTPASGGTGMVVSGASTPSLSKGTIVSGGISYANGAIVVGGTVSGGTTQSLSSYSGGNGGNGPGH